MTYPGFSYSGPYHPGQVRGAAPACEGAGCRLSEALVILGRAQELSDQLAGERKVMLETAALWCDTGHAFSARDRGRKQMTVTVLNEENGNPETETRQFCGACTITPAVLNEPVLRTLPPGRAFVDGPADDRG